MSVEPDILKPIRDSAKFPQLLDQLKSEWESEQEARHEFWKKQDEGVKAEFINGIGIYHSPVYGRHWMVMENITYHLLPFIRNNSLGRMAWEKVLCRFTRNDYEPDIVFWSSSKANKFEQKQSAFPPPDFIVEILSKSTEARDRGVKLDDYSLHGVCEYWIVDPEHFTVEQYIQENNQLILALKLHEGIIRSHAIHGFEINIADIFKEVY